MIKIASFAAAAAIALAGASIAIAAGDGGGSSNSTPSTTSTKKTCKKGTVVKMVTKNGRRVATCVKAKSSGLTDGELYAQGRELAKDGEYEWALDVLAEIKDQNQPRVLNYIGYSHRKAGRLETGITYYYKALAIDPNYVLAREYLGEGYVAAGRIELAQLQLAEIGKRCGVACEEYKALSAAIATAVQ